ncbi:MAG TPA: DUF2442 domain-containing protein [Bacteroidia bacterium]|nr:DUF2442 domain-containing protein [Bacteroidia bacterium]
MKQKTKVSATEKFLIIETPERSYSFSWHKISSRLDKATHLQRSNFIVSPSGYGIHWSDIDEDLSIPALLAAPKKKQTSGMSVSEPMTDYKRRAKKRK